MGVPQNIHKVSLWEIQVNLRHIWAYTKKDVVGDTGIEPVTSSVSRKRASPCANRPWGPSFEHSVVSEVETGFEPVYAALQAAASPLGHSTMRPAAAALCERTTGFEPATLTLAR